MNMILLLLTDLARWLTKGVHIDPGFALCFAVAAAVIWAATAQRKPQTPPRGRYGE